MTLKKFILPALIMTAAIASAQSRYDDDIYYNASKDTKTKQENAEYKKKQAERKAREAEQQRMAEQEAFNRLYQMYYGDYDPERGGQAYEAAGDINVDTYGSARDVDEYNRRGAFAQKRTMTDSIPDNQDFAYTRRIERFHNGDIIAETKDPELIDYYYSSQQQPEINIYLVNDPWNNWAWNGWNNWGWGPYSYYYSPYYSPYWGWNNYWSWNWGWTPGWGPSWSWSWGWGSPAWGWGPGWGWNYPSWGWSGPINNAVASRYTPNGRRPTGIRNGYTGFGGNRGQLSTGNNNTTRPRNNRYTLTPGQVGNYRPGQSSTYRPNQSGNINNNVNSGTYQPGTTSGNRGNRNSYSRPNTPRNTYNNSGSFNSGSSSRGSWGGGSTGGSTGGGGHRGGRR